MLGKIWDFLNTPPPQISIPAVEEFATNIEEGVARWLLSQVLHVTEWTANVLLVTPVEFMNSEAFRDVYSITSLISLAAVLPYVAYLGFMQMNGRITPMQLGNSLKKIFVLPAFNIFAPIIIKLMINLCNRLSAAILSGAINVPLREILHPAGVQMGLFIFLGIYLFLVLKLLLFYAYRNYALLALVALSPLMYLVWSFPGRNGKFNVWSREIIVLLTTQIVHAIQIVILVSLTVGAGAVSEPGIPLLVFQTGAMLFITKTPEWLKEFLHEAPDPLQGWRGMKKMQITKLARGLKDVIGK